MITTILNSFIPQLNFIHQKKIQAHQNNYKLNISNIDPQNNQIIGTIITNPSPGEYEEIIFITHFSISDDILIFRTTYTRYKNNIKEDIKKEQVDTFAIIEQEKKAYYTPKTKYLIHLVDGNIMQAYMVNKKYKFSNGLSENFTKLNMNNKEIVADVNNSYEKQSKKR